MNADSKRDASRSEHQGAHSNAKRGSHPHPIHPSGLFLSADVNSPYAAAASALAMAAGGGGGGLLRSPPFLGGPSLGSPTPSSPGPGDNPGLMALYQSPLWQAAMRQQQLQLLSHLASLSNPFLSAAQGQPQPPPPPPQMPPFSASSFPPSMEAAHMYRDYLNKYAQAHSTTTSTTSTTSSSARLLTSTSSTSTTSSAQAAALVANLMAAAGKPTSSSSDFTNSSISTTTGIHSGAPDSRGHAVRFGSDKRAEPRHSPSSFLSSGTGGVERRDNNNGKHLLSPDGIKSESSPPHIPTSIAPVAQSIIGTGRGSGGRTSSGRGRGRGGGGGGGGSAHATSASSSDPYNGRDKVFTCKICNRSFGYKHVLQNHERTHTGEKPFECRVCHKRFTRDHHLKTHMRLHTGEKPYNCTHCDRQFVQVANLRRHLRVHTGEKPYKCDLCDSTFSDSNQLKAHVLIHKGEKPFSCEKCEGKFRRRHHLMHHACPMSKNPGIGITYDEDDDLDSVTSPSSDSIRHDRESEFGFPTKKMRSLASPHFDPELEKKFYRGELGVPGSKGPSGLELSLMFAAAAAAAESSEKRNHSGGISSGGSARSRKSRDPKRVRPSADHSPKSDEMLDESSDTNSGKILSTSAMTSFDAAEIDSNNIPRSEKHFERTSFQTEPEDLSSSCRHFKREDIGEEEEEKENLDELDVSTSSDRVSATATVSSTTDPTSLTNLGGPIMNKMPIVNK